MKNYFLYERFLRESFFLYMFIHLLFHIFKETYIKILSNFLIIIPANIFKKAKLFKKCTINN